MMSTRLLAASWLLMVSGCVLAQSDDPTPTPELGASVYKNRCVICHGKDGMGEGIVALKMKDYPDTNLRKAKEAKGESGIRRAVVYGGVKGDLSPFMPPLGDELTWTQIESVVQFVGILREDNPKARQLLREVKDVPGRGSYRIRKLGRNLYESRCALCHGKEGDGTGRMAKVIRSPPPANLIVSRLPDDYLQRIIVEGGEALERSPQMPPWGMQFDQDEIEAIMAYVKSLRSAESK